MGPSFFEEVSTLLPLASIPGVKVARYANGITNAKRPEKRAWYAPFPSGRMATRIGPRCPVDPLRHSPRQTPLGSVATADAPERNPKDPVNAMSIHVAETNALG